MLVDFLGSETFPSAETAVALSVGGTVNKPLCRCWGLEDRKLEDRKAGKS
jgi:hypothetical protein